MSPVFFELPSYGKGDVLEIRLAYRDPAIPASVYIAEVVLHRIVREGYSLAPMAPKDVSARLG